MEMTLLEDLLQKEMKTRGFEGKRIYASEIVRLAELDCKIRGYTFEDIDKWKKSRGRFILEKDPRASEFQWMVYDGIVPPFIRVWADRGLRMTHTISYGYEERNKGESNEERADRAIKSKEFGTKDINLKIRGRVIVLLGMDYENNFFGEFSVCPITLKEIYKQNAKKRLDQFKRIALGNNPGTVLIVDENKKPALIKWYLEEDYNPQQIVKGLMELV